MFVELTKRDGATVSVNPDKVMTVFASSNETGDPRCTIVLETGSGIEVSGTYEDTLAVLAGPKPAPARGSGG